MPVRPLLLTLLACAALTGCATPENRRELYGPYHPYKPIPYSKPPGRDTVYLAPKDTTTWYGPDQKELITGRWGMAGHIPYLNYPQTPPGIEQRVISRINPKGLSAQKIANRELAQR